MLVAPPKDEKKSSFMNSVWQLRAAIVEGTLLEIGKMETTGVSRVVCVADRRLWWSVVKLTPFFLLFLFGVIATPPPGSYQWIILPLSFGVAIGLTIWHLQWTRFVADESGLSWRTWVSLKQHYVPWEQVRSFYLTPSPYGNAVVETEEGQIIVGKDYKGRAELLAFIDERAKAVEGRGWWLRKSNLGFGELRIYQYNPRSLLRFPVIASIIGTALSTNLVPMIFFPGRTLPNMGTDLFAAVILPLGCIIPGLIVWISFVRHIALKRHLKDQITVSREGISWIADGQSSAAAWHEVTALEPPSLKRRIASTLQTHNGNLEIEFSGIQDGEVLRDIILRHLPNSPEAEVRS